jgi:sugar phosphate isomerase/epimerase
MSRYPWRLGATSWVVPADLLTNVRLLAERVDDIQLLFFESTARSRLAHDPGVGELACIAADHDLSFTVHLPTDLRLGAADAATRCVGVEEILRLAESLAPLSVRAFDLHLEPEPDLAPADWLGYVERSLADLAEKMCDDRVLLAIENTGAPPEELWALARRYGFSICLDVGHLLQAGCDWRQAFDRHLPAVRHLHYHGVRAGRDHRAVDVGQDEVSRALGAALYQAGYQGVVTLEVYTEERLSASLAALEKAWEEFEG